MGINETMLLLNYNAQYKKILAKEYLAQQKKNIRHLCEMAPVHTKEKVTAHYKHLAQWYQGSPLISNLRPERGRGGGH